MGLNEENTVHLDAFLYGPEEEDNLVSEGKLPKGICSDCGSMNTEEITILTHSCSHDRLEYMFRCLLPSLKGKTVLDVGSRLGAVLFGAFYHSSAVKIIGVEMNGDLCQTSERIIKKYQLGKRIEIVNENILDVPKLLKSADVIVLNNVFEWFQSLEEQIKIWRYLKETMNPGTLLVTIPALDASLEHLDTGICLEDWVSEEEPADPHFVE